jgi:hypothetical protein
VLPPAGIYHHTSRLTLTRHIHLDTRHIDIDFA